MINHMGISSNNIMVHQKANATLILQDSCNQSIIRASPWNGAPSPQFGIRTEFKPGAIRVSAAEAQTERIFLF